MKAKTNKANGGVKTGVLRILMSFFILNFAFCIALSAQDGPEDAAPPPLRVMSQNERDRLTSELGLKDRTKLALELMAERMGMSEKLAAAGDHAGMYTELGGFHALMDHIIEHLDKVDEKRSKVLDNYKRLEQGLRTFVPRLETLRREVPLKYEHYLRKLIKYVRDTRTRALEPMFSDTVVRGNDPRPKRKP